jgi:hypothetical protein
LEGKKISRYHLGGKCENGKEKEGRLKIGERKRKKGGKKK